MKTMKSLKITGLLLLAAITLFGCATAPEPEPEAGATAADAQAAIAAAKAANDRVAAVGYEWRDTAKLIEQAEKAAADGNFDEAVKLANQARSQAEIAYQQYLDQTRSQAAAEPAAPVATPTRDQYSVVRGDSLWKISGRDEVYGNPYQWPLIYRANQDKIQDADLIYPGQNLSIDRGASQADVNAAVRHARTRGNWSLGVVEESDRAYLGR